MNWTDLDDAEFVEKVKETIDNSMPLVERWRTEAKEAFDMYAGRQWSEDDIAYLNEQERPVITFNKARVIVDAVSGNEMVNRQEPRFLPRGNEDVATSDIMTGVVRWVRHLSDGEFEDSDAFRDTCVAGMGWVEFFMAYDTNPDGEIRMQRIDPLEFAWDPAARRPNLLDGRWIAREKMLEEDEIKRMWPDSEAVKSGSVFRKGDNPVDRDEAKFYRGGNTVVNDTRIPVMEVEWFELEPFWRYENEGQLSFTNDKDVVKALKASGAKVVKQHRRVYQRAIIIGEEVVERDTPIVNDFTYRCITGFRDRSDDGNSWFGLMRPMKDPQQWYNKFYSQILHIINSNAKGGFFWETGAVRYPDRMTNDMAKPDRGIELNPGGLGRVKERQMFQFPSSLDRMMQLSNAGLLETTGVNIELLGLTNRDQPGVLESQRQQQALTIVSTLFDSLRRYRKEQGKLLMTFIRDFVSDDRVARIVSQTGAQQIRITKDLTTMEYDIVVDQAVTSPNARIEAWNTLSTVIGPLAQMGFVPPPDILDYLPLPASITEAWKKNVGPQIPPEVQQKVQQMAEQLQVLQEENTQLKSKESQDLRRTEVKAQQGQMKAQLQAQETQGNLALKNKEIEGNFFLKQLDTVLRNRNKEGGND